MKLDDSVLCRIVQIVQEGFLMGIDVADLMRQIVLIPSEIDSQNLVLDPDYVIFVEKMHEKYLVEAAQKQLEIELAKGLDSQEAIISR